MSLAKLPSMLTKSSDTGAPPGGACAVLWHQHQGMDPRAAKLSYLLQSYAVTSFFSMGKGFCLISPEPSVYISTTISPVEYAYSFFLLEVPFVFLAHTPEVVISLIIYLVLD